MYVVVYLKCRLRMVGGREYPLFLEGTEYIGISWYICSIRGELLIKMKGYIIPLLFLCYSRRVTRGMGIEIYKSFALSDRRCATACSRA